MQKIMIGGVIKLKKAIVVDIDSTIWDINQLCIPAAEKLYGYGYDHSELTHWDALRDKYGPDFFDIYEEGLRKEDIPKRQMFEGVDEVLTALSQDLGYIIHFITHNEATPNEMEIYLEKWIHDEIPDLNFYMTVLNNQKSKIDFANSLIIYDLFGIIDDKPKTLREAVDKKVPFVATKKWKFNEDVRKNNPDIVVFDSWWDLLEVFDRMERTAEARRFITSFL